MKRRSDIPYAARIQMAKLDTIGRNRGDAAAVSAKLALVAINELFGIGFERGIQFAQLYMKLDTEFYADREIEEAHLNERLRKMGYIVDKHGKVHAVVDPDGKPIKAQDVDKHGGLPETIEKVSRLPDMIGGLRR